MTQHWFWRKLTHIIIVDSAVIIVNKQESWCLELQATRLFVQQFVQVNVKENNKALITGPLCRESTGRF